MKTLSKNFWMILIAASCGFYGEPSSVMAAVANVTATAELTFVPATTNINVNDTVTWTWPNGSDNHNVTSTSMPQSWTASPTENGPFTFSVTFTNAGTFPYECTIHAAENMKGSIIVASAPVTPPSLAITNPVSGAVFSAPASVKMLTSVTNGSSSVTNVQFYTNNVSLLAVSTAPFNLTASNLPAGSYALKAVATAGGITGTSPVVNISVVTPMTVSLSNSTSSFSTNFQFSYPANIGLSYVVQVSTNLSLENWISLATNVAASNPVVFVDSRATNNAGFYRVGLLPNP